jgi:hypothetical protein
LPPIKQSSLSPILLEEAVLERNQWRMLPSGDRSGIEDSLEAVLEASTVPDKLELSDDEDCGLAPADEYLEYDDDSR